jgi:FMN-dependent NADH-azoreductase
MPKLLHIACSPRADSASGAAAQAFLAAFRAHRPSWEIDALDLWREGLPEIDLEMLDAKDAVQRGASFRAKQQEAWSTLERMAVRFALAERVLISTPMWNFGLPYKLKQHIDLINQPRLTFRFDPAAGYVPLLKDRPTVAIVASSGDYVTGMNRGRIDMATPYLREALRFMGVRTVEFVALGPTAGPTETIRAAREGAHRRLIELASRF